MEDAAQYDLLLVATREGLRSAGLMSLRPHGSASWRRRHRAVRAAYRAGRAGQPVKPGERAASPRTLRTSNRAEALRSSGTKPIPGGSALCGSPRSMVFPVIWTVPRLAIAPPRASPQFRLAGADKTGHTQDLATAQCEGGWAQASGVVKPSRLQELWCLWERHACRRNRRSRATIRRRVHLRWSPAEEPRYEKSITQDCGDRSDGIDLGHAVGDHQDCGSGVALLAHQRQQPLGRRLGQAVASSRMIKRALAEGRGRSPPPDGSRR